MHLPTRRSGAYLPPRARRALSILQVLVLVLSLVVPALPAAAMPAVQEETPVVELPPAEIVVEEEDVPVVEIPPVEDLVLPEAPAHDPSQLLQSIQAGIQALICTNDVNGANDEVGQGDLTRFCADDLVNNVQSVKVNWDKINWTGQSGTACLLYDTNANVGNNYALCVGIASDGAGGVRISGVYPYLCQDDRINKPLNCWNPTPTTAISAVCTASITQDDPFYAQNVPPDTGSPIGTGEAYPNDSAATCTVTYSGGAVGAAIANFCAYTNPTDAGSDAKDCIAKPAGGFITIRKIANPSPNTPVVAFPFAITGPDPTINTTIYDSNYSNQFSVSPGTYSVSEAVPTGWDLTAASCNDGVSTSTLPTVSGIKVDPADDITCTFNDVKRGKIIIKKQTDPDGATQSFEFDPSYSTTNFFLTDGQTNESSWLVQGTYSVAEVNVPTGWSPTGSSCDDGSPVTAISLQPGEIVKCTFNNARDTGSLQIIKDVYPDGMGNWNFAWIGPTPGNCSLSGDGSCTAQSVYTGSYTIVETGGSGTLVTDYTTTWSCTVNGSSGPSGSSTTASGITVAKNDVVVCTFTNTLLTGTLVVTKVLPNDNSGTKTCSDFSFTVNGGAATPFEADCSNSQTVLVGTYDIEEAGLPVAGYDTTYNNCTDVVVSAGETETCTITNDDQPNPAIDVEKYVSADGGATWDDADTAPGPHLLSTVSPQFKFVVTNSGDAPLTNISLTDSDFDLSSCTIPTTLAKAASFECIITVAWAAGQHTDTATAAGVYGTTTYEDTDDANYYGATPAITVDKTASPTAVPETGGNVVFTFKVTNTGNVPVAIMSLNDSVYGALAGDADCQVGTVLAPNASCEFATTQWLAGSFCGTPHANTFTTHASFSGTDVWDDDDATVGFTDVVPVIQVTKTASPTSVPETGGDVTFTFLVENTGQQDVMLSALTDTVFGDLDGKGTCAVPQTILIGGSYTCEYTVNLASDSLTAHTNSVTATASDSCDTPATDTDDETVTFDDVAPVIRVTKTADPLHVPETGGDVKFTFLVENIGPEDVTLTSLVDDKFGDLDSKGTCDVPQPILIGGSYTCEYTVNLASDSLTPHTNVVTATAVDDDYTAASDTDDATVTFDDVAPDITITKTASPTSVPETGANVTFTFLVENIGVEDVTLTSLTDSVFGDLNGQGTCATGGPIAVGGSYMCSITKFLASDSLTPHTNVVTAVGTDDDGTTDTATDDETVTFDDIAPDISITKTADPTHVPETGANVTFTFVVTNDGVEDVTLTSLTDSVFGNLDGQGTCATGGPIAVGGSYTCSITKFLASDLLTPHTNVVTAVGTDDDGTADTATDDETVTFDDVLPTVDLTKTADPLTRPEPGGVFVFTLTIHNTSPEMVWITELLDDNELSSECQQLVGNSIVAGGTASCTYSVTHSEAGTYPNTAWVEVADNDNNPASDSDDETVTVTDVLPTVDLTKSATPQSLPEPGGVNTFTLNVHNTSPEAVTITALTDTNALSAECLALVGTTLSAGASTSCTYAVTHTEAGVYPNTASVTVADNEGNPASDSDWETVSVNDVLPDVALDKSVTPAFLDEPGGVFHFTLTITNNSVEEVTITALTDDNALSAGCLALIETKLAAGASTSCMYDVTHTEAGSYPNTASVTVADNEGNEDTATASASVEVLDVLPDIAITKVASPLSMDEPGGEFTFTYVVTNNGVENVTVTSVTDSVIGVITLPADVILAPGESTVAFTGKWTYTEAAVYPNTVTAKAVDNEGNEDTATASASVEVLDVLPTVDLTKTVMPSSLVEPGGVFHFTLTIHNTSVEAVEITALSDTNALSPECTALVGTTLAVGASTSCTYDVTHILAGSYPNTASVTVKDNENNSASDSASQTVTVAPRAGALLPTQKTCQDYVSGNWYPMYSQFSYQVGKANAISAVSPGVIFYYNTITAPSASFSIYANETNPLNWRSMLWQDAGQAILYTSTCDKATGFTVTQIGTAPYLGSYGIRFDVTGATPGATYYIGIKYSPQNLVGQKVQKSGGKYPTNNYSWATSMGGVTSGAVSIPVAPKK